MELTSKQKAQLKGLASTAETVVQIGKGGITDNVIQSVEDALRTRELVKGKVLETAEVTPREACDELCAACGAEPVQVIGTKFVIYKKNKKDPKFVLVKASKKQ